VSELEKSARLQYGHVSRDGNLEDGVSKHQMALSVKALAYHSIVMVLRDVILNKFADWDSTRWLQVVLILSLGGSANSSLYNVYFGTPLRCILSMHSFPSSVQLTLEALNILKV
jgi:hypothetical protein